MSVPENVVSESARTLAQLGASKGGIARRATLTAEERRSISRRAAAARWGKSETATEESNGKILQATFGTADHPLRLGDEEIPCYIVESDGDPIRVLVMTGMLKALDMSLGGSRQGNGGTRLYRFIDSQALRGYASAELLEKVNNPIHFRTPAGATAYGYEASILADICDVVLEVRRAGHLRRQQEHIAKKCEILMRGWARTGLTALIDEATGFQYFRARYALEKVLEQYINKELLKWQKMFPDDYYAELFRLKRWPFEPTKAKRPGIIGHLTNDVIYSRLAPGVLEELQRLTPRSANGRRTHKYHQRLTEDVGHPKLREHLAAVIALMRASDSWDGFYRLVQRAFPKLNSTMLMPIPETDP